MISKAKVLAMAALIGMDKKAVEAAYDAEAETDIDIPSDLVIRTKSGDDKFQREKYEEGKTAGVEVSVKEFKAKSGLKFTGKDLDSLAEAIRAEGDTDGKVKKLQDNLKEAEGKVTTLQAQLSEVSIETKALDAIPKEYNGLSRRELLAVARANGLSFKEEEDGSLGVYRGGKRVRDEKTQSDLPANDAMTMFFEKERKMSLPGGDPDPEKKGRGGKGGDPIPQTEWKRSAIEKEFRDKNPTASVNGMEYQSFYASKVREAASAKVEILHD